MDCQKWEKLADIIWDGVLGDMMLLGRIAGVIEWMEFKYDW